MSKFDKLRNHPATTEPADPNNPDHQARRETRFAPQTHVDKLPDPLKECGCGDCPPGADPLAENDSGESIAEVCDSPRAVTVERAGEIHVKYDWSNLKKQDITSKYEHHIQKYAKILEADRKLMGEYEGLTTAMATRRIDPIGLNGEWMCPWDMLEYLFACNIHHKMRNSIDYRLKSVKNIEYNYLRVLAPTESGATPHEHWYVWANDPNNELTTADFVPALQKHLDYCPVAHEEHHQYADDGSEGAITVRYNPPVTDEPPEKLDSIDSPNNGYDDSDGYQTQGAQYLASQLAYLPLGDLRDGTRNNPYATLLEGAAICWMSDYDWFSSSHGL